MNPTGSSACPRTAGLLGPRLALVCLCALALLLTPSPTQALEGPVKALGQEASPNLVPFPPTNISSGVADGSPFRPPYALRFSVTVANRGQVPFDFESQDHPEDPNRKIAAQCVAWVAQRVCSRRSPTGEFVYHPTHGHYHITDFARYELRTLDQEGAPDLSPEGLVAGGQKVSYCVQDTGTDSQTWSPLWPPSPFYALCGEGRQGISPGQSDTYGSTLDGQQILLPQGIEDGFYAVVVVTDPTNRFYEGPRQDNVASTTVEILHGGAVAYEVYGQ